MSNPFPIDDVSLTAVTDLMSDSGLDTIWLDLDGDMVPETMIQTDGPFAVDDTNFDDAGYDQDTYELNLDPDSYDDASWSDGGLVGEPINSLTPWDAAPGTTDVWSLPDDGADWCDMQAYDPMDVPSDWTVDGYADPSAYDAADTGPFDMNDPSAFTDPGAFTDTGGYYDSTGYYDTTSYYDTANTGYYDTGTDYDPSGADYDPSGAYDPTAGYDPGTMATDTWDSWDPTGTDTTFDTSYSDPTNYYDPTAGYDPSGFDATAGYDPSGYETGDDPTAGYDPSGYDSSSYDTGYDATADQGTEIFDVDTNVEVTDTWDGGLAMEQSQPWTDLSVEQSDASWDLYDMSNDAAAAGDYDLSYDLNNASTDAWNDSYDSYAYSNDVYFDQPTGYDATTSYDVSSYDSSTWDSTSYDATDYTTTDSYTYETPVTDATYTSDSYDTGGDW